jgi:Ni,Fe-hydrogenase III large subunit
MDLFMPYLHNGESLPLAHLPVVEIELFRETVLSQIEEGGHLSALFVAPRNGRFLLFALISVPDREQVGVLATEVEESYWGLTPYCAQAHWFEREIYEQWGIEPKGHPWLKPIRFSPARRGGRKADTVGVTDFFALRGDEVHEVAVGPVHAGVIEPGHFRFQCHGETVHHLEISLGYQHRGVERALTGGPTPRTIHLMETLAGDTTIGHTTAYCAMVEALSATTVPPGADSIRAIAAELERMANHIGDLGALAGDVGFLPTANYCGRIRGDVLNLTALICGNRFGRGLVIPGGVRFDVDSDRRMLLQERIQAVEADLNSAVPLMFAASSVLARFEGTGTLLADTARELGLVGVAARACGLSDDVRFTMPYSAYRFDNPPSATYHTGDCFARAYVRWMEIEQSLAFIRRQLAALAVEKSVLRPCGERTPDALAVTLVEGWRGEICHVAGTDDQGRFAFYKVVDPSFHNWFGLAFALRGQAISDFPLCNKSFNLSYCGHDL